MILPFTTSASEIPRSSSLAGTAQWWDADWSYRKPITIDHTKVASPLTNFPVLISLPSDPSLAAHAQSDGDDIVFTDSNGNQLNHELELFSSTTGRLVAWVNVPSLSATTDTLLYLYYGNSACSTQQHPPGTWDSSYLIVHHMEEPGDIYDSTSHALHAENHGTTTEPNGKINGCRSYDNLTDHYNFGNSTLLNPGMNSWTITLWTKLTYVFNHDLLVKYSSSANTGFFLNLNNNSNGYNYFKVGDGTHITARYWNTPWTDENWHYLTIIINRNTNTIDVYLDGTLHNGGGQGNITGFGSIASATTFRLYGGTNGSHDEFTISTTIRNPGWIHTSYTNQHDPTSFYILGIEQTPLTPPPITGPSWGFVNVEYLFTSTMTTPDAESFSYQWDWGDGNISEWLGPYPSGQIVSESHIWSAKGTYDIRIRVKDSANQGSGWSDPHPIIIGGIRKALIIGNQDQKTNEGDYILFHAVDLRMVLFKPFEYHHYTAGETIIITNQYQGLLLKKIIIGFFEVIG